MRSVVILCCVFLLGGWTECRKAPDKPASTSPSTTLEPPKPPTSDDPLEQAKYDMQRLKEAAAQAEARYEVLKKQATDDAIRAQTMWITGICLLLAAVAGVAAFLVPVGKKTLVAAAAGFTTIAACAQAFQAAVPYLPWIGGAAIIGGGIWAAINWRKLGDATRAAADYGDRLEQWLADLPEEAREHAEKIIADAKLEAKQQAQRMGVHSQLQYLRGKSPSLWTRVTKKVA